MKNLALMWVLLVVFMGCGGRETQGKPETANAPTAGMPADMVFVEGGTFTMGCTAARAGECGKGEKPAHEVTLSGYYISKFEVTQGLWESVMDGNPSEFTGNINLPVESVSWNSAQEFIRKLNEKTGKSYRLPTEAEWEYAARGGKGGKGYRYSGADVLSGMAWYDDNSAGKTHPVGDKRPNGLGLHDMSGNVREWVNDSYADYGSRARTNPAGPLLGVVRAVRGGGWRDDAKYCRVSTRLDLHQYDSSAILGFRLAHDAGGSAAAPAAGSVYVKDGFRHLAPDLVQVKGQVMSVFSVPVPNAVGMLDESDSGIVLIKFNGYGKKPEYAIAAKDSAMGGLEIIESRFSVNFSEETIAYSLQSESAVLANVKTGEAFRAKCSLPEGRSSHYMVEIRFLDPQKNLFAIVKSINNGGSNDGWEDYLHVVKLEGRRLADTGFMMHIGHTRLVLSYLPLYHRWFVHDRKLFVYNDGKIHCTDGSHPVPHPFSAAFNGNSERIGEIHDFAIHPKLPFGVAIHSDGINHRLTVLNWKAERPEEQVAAFDNILNKLAPLFDLERAALAFQSFSPDGKWYVVGGVEPEMAAKGMFQAPFFVAIPVDGKRSDFLAFDEAVVLGQVNKMFSFAWTTEPAAFVVSNADNRVGRWVLDGARRSANKVNGREPETQKLIAGAAARRTGILDIEMIFVEGATLTDSADTRMVLKDGDTAEWCDDCDDGCDNDCDDDDEIPARNIAVDNFYIGKYEVTQGQWKVVMGDNPSVCGGYDNMPVENVSWDDVQVFIQKLNAKTGKEYRLPSSDEWEYAAKGGNKSKGYKYSGSNNIDDVARPQNDDDERCVVVGTKRPNELGIHDMSGNVDEWTGTRVGDSHVMVRVAGEISKSYRYRMRASRSGLGFRLARDP